MRLIYLVPFVLAAIFGSHALAQNQVCRIVEGKLECDPPPEGRPGGTTAQTVDEDPEIDAADALRNRGRIEAILNDPNLSIRAEALRNEMRMIVDEMGVDAAREMIDDIEDRL